MIIHAAAVRKVESVENDFEGAMQLNKNATEHLAQLAGLIFFAILIFNIC